MESIGPCVVIRLGDILLAPALFLFILSLFVRIAFCYVGLPLTPHSLVRIRLLSSDRFPSFSTGYLQVTTMTPFETQPSSNRSLDNYEFTFETKLQDLGRIEPDASPDHASHLLSLTDRLHSRTPHLLSCTSAFHDTEYPA